MFLVLDPIGRGLERATMEIGDLLTIDLEALAGGFNHKDPAFIIHFHGDRPVEQLLPLHKTLRPISASHHSRVQLQPLPAPL